VKADKSAAAPVLAVFDAGSGIAVMDLANEVPYGHIPLEKTQRGRAEYAVSDDCRWLATGDDDGHVTLWSLETNKSVPLTPDGRPAHGAPVVGLAFSVTAQSGEPDYLVSAGEENAIKLWLIHDRLQDLQGIAPASRLTKDTAQVQARRASE
jgi:WD40 repeat protein